MTRNREGWHYIAVKILAALLRAITSKGNGDYYFLNCLYWLRTKSELGSHIKVCENKKFCNILMSSEETKMLEFSQYRKSDKVPFIIYADLESLIAKIDGCKNNPEKPSATKVREHIPSSFSMPTIPSFKGIENKHYVYRGTYCMRTFSESLRKHVMKIINLKKKKIEIFNKKTLKINILKLEIIVIIQVNTEVLQMVFLLFFIMDLTMIIIL